MEPINLRLEALHLAVRSEPDTAKNTVDRAEQYLTFLSKGDE